MKKTNINVIIIGCTALGVMAAAGAETPKGWFPAGSHPKDYEMAIDRSAAHSRKASACLKSIAPKPGGFGTLMQTCKADAFLGKRVRMSGYVQSKEVMDWAGLWLRVDGSKGEPLAFDNMQDRPIKGTGEWRRCEIVLDVSDQAQELAFGVLLSGRGQVWVDDLKFELVGKDVPTTGGSAAKGTPAEPTNLDFEE